MSKKAVAWTLALLGATGIGWLALSAMPESGPWVINFFDRREALAGCLVVMGIGATVDLLPSKRLAAALTIVTTLLMVAVLLGMRSFSVRKWQIVALVLIVVPGAIAGLISADSRREKLAVRIIVAVGMSAVLVMAGITIVVVDEPWF